MIISSNLNAEACEIFQFCYQKNRNQHKSIRKNSLHFKFCQDAYNHGIYIKECCVVCFKHFQYKSVVKFGTTIDFIKKYEKTNC